jgi:hypothetical protein
MSDIFFEKSKKIADDFIQSIVFLDDKAYQNEGTERTNHDFNALKISQVFSKENKICAVYKPETKKDIENFKQIARKADITILDWQINIPSVVTPENAGDDDEDDDPRGQYTKEIIKSILLEDELNRNALKLIIVYTGDYSDLAGISEDIYKNVFNSKNFKLYKKNCAIESSNFKVLIRAKEVELSNSLNKRKYKNKILKYDEVPSYVLCEFTKMTSGLLSNFALLALTILRQNSSKILTLFTKEVDSAFLSHKALLPNQEDAEDLLIELFGDSISDLLSYNKISEDISLLIEDWIKSSLEEENRSVLKKNGQPYNPDSPFTRKFSLLLALLNSQDINVEQRYKDTFISNGISNTKAEEYYKYISLNNTQLFVNNSKLSTVDSIDKKFSILTHHKSLFIPQNTIPKLSLGSVIRSTKNVDIYYICIQQKCDSVRIARNHERKFLFIPLKVSTDKFDIITPKGIKLKRDKSSFAIRTIKFVCIDDRGVIKAEKDTLGRFIFKQKYNSRNDEQFEWILDLKDLHSQRIIAEYVATLSRVGLNESELLSWYLC